MQHADIKDIFFFHEHLERHLSRIIQYQTSNETSHKTQDLECEPTTQEQNADQLTEQQVQVFIYSYHKVRRITYKLKSISRRYGILILIHSIMHILLKDKSN